METSHEGPAITSLLALLEKDILTGQYLCTLPDELVQAMLATLIQPVDLYVDLKHEHNDL